MVKPVHYVSHYCGQQECDFQPRCNQREGDNIKVSSIESRVTCKNCLSGMEKDKKRKRGREVIDDPVNFELPQMEQALAGKRHTTPDGLTRGQFKAWLLGEAETLSGAVRLKLELDRLDSENQSLRDALVKIIEMNRQHAEDQYGDPEKAESWSCVTVARAALNKEKVQ